MKRGAYCGPRAELLGETALLREPDMSGFRDDISQRHWLAQFDNKDRFGECEGSLAFGWHAFDYDDFEVIPDEDRT